MAYCTFLEDHGLDPGDIEAHLPAIIFASSTKVAQDQIAALPEGWMRDVATTMGEDAHFDTFAGELGGAMAESGEKTVLHAIDRLLPEFDLDLAAYDELLEDLVKVYGICFPMDAGPPSTKDAISHLLSGGGRKLKSDVVNGCAPHKRAEGSFHPEFKMIPDDSR